jgi:RNA polymerase sigma factor (sigma-70 family)
VGPVRPDDPSRADVEAPPTAEPRFTGRVSDLVEGLGSLKSLAQFALSQLGHGTTAQDAEDALQDFWDKQLDKVVASYREGSQSFRSYLKTCLKRFCWRRGAQLRRSRSDFHKFQGATRAEAPSIGVSERRDDLVQRIEDELESEEREIAMREALTRLPAKDQEILHLRFEEGRSLLDIAAQLAISEDAVKKRVERAKARLKRQMNTGRI